MKVLYNAGFDGWHIITERMTLEKWLEIAQSLSTW